MAHKKISGVYKITNVETGKFYIGSSNSMRRRWYEHRKLLKKNNHPNPYLQASWNKHGCEAFVIEYLEVIEDDNERARCEARFVKSLRPEYNLANVVRNENLGRKQSDETKEKIRQARLGRKHSLETCAKMSCSAKGRVFSDEWRRQHSAKMKGRKRPTAVVEAIRKYATNRERDVNGRFV